MHSKESKHYTDTIRIQRRFEGFCKRKRILRKHPRRVVWCNKFSTMNRRYLDLLRMQFLLLIFFLRLNIRRLHQEAMMVERKLMISDRSKIKIQRMFLNKKKKI
jgi:hypothetical protein